MSAPCIVYLHGFLSSPQSRKARQTSAFAASRGLADNLLIPCLNQSPADNLNRLQRQLDERADRQQLALIGSSLGGFYATCLAEHYRAPAVLVNPAVRPHQRWHEYLGSHRNYHNDEIYTVTRAHVEQLERLCPAQPARPDNYLVFLQRQDEVLDYRQALDYYGPAQCRVRDDGNHAYAEFEQELPATFDFLLSRIAPDVR